MIKRIISTSVLVVITCIVRAQVSVSSIFCNNMVLQRNIEVPIWGTSLTENEKITVEFAGQNIVTNAIHGKWMVKLKPLKANAQPETLTISGSNNKITITNVLVGEVWLCGGQSNMERQLGLRNGQKPLLNWEQEASMASYPQIREFALPHVNDVTMPITSLKAKWIVCETQSVKQFSAIGYFFGKALHEKLKVPIGLIHSSWGGTPAEKWISRQALDSNSELKKIVENYDKAIADYPTKLLAYKKDEQTILQQWVADTLLAKQQGKPLPRKPVAPINPQKSGDCGGLFTTMIEPLIPYAIKGVIWYQGEANVGNPKQYKILFPALIADWRAKWQEGDFPFLFVQLAPYKSNTPELREAQLYTWQTVPNTAMVVTIDCGDTTDIHPTNKKPVGERLALAARALAYEEQKLEYSGPVYQSMKINKNKIELSFTHVGRGLWAKDGELYGFAISKDGQKFIPATAIIDKDKIVVFANGVNPPIAVHYAFINNAKGNLYNLDGLPASPFRTEINGWNIK